MNTIQVFPLTAIQQFQIMMRGLLKIQVFHQAILIAKTKGYVLPFQQIKSGTLKMLSFFSLHILEKEMSVEEKSRKTVVR